MTAAEALATAMREIEQLRAQLKDVTEQRDAAERERGYLMRHLAEATAEHGQDGPVI